MMNVKYLFPFFLLLLASGCSLLKKPEKTQERPSGEELIRTYFERRFRDIRADRELHAAFCPSGPPAAYLIDGKACGTEADALRLLASVTGWKVTFSVCTRAELAALVRCGKADVGVGGFTEKDAEELGLAVFTVQNRQGKNRVFLVSPHAVQLRETLGKASRQ